MKKWKWMSKTIAASACTAVLAIGLAACSGSGNDNAASPDDAASVSGVDELTYRGFSWGWDYPDPNKDVMAPELSRLLGFKLTAITEKLGSYTDVEQRIQLWASNGMQDWPNLLWLGWSDNANSLVNRLGKEGRLIDWNEYKDQLPEVMEAAKYAYPFLGDGEGHTYMLPLQFSDIGVYKIDTGNWIRQDLLDQAGLPVPDTISEFEAALRAFKQMKTADGKAIIPYMPFGEAFYNMIPAFYPYEVANGMWITKDGKPYNVDVEEPQYLIRALKKHNEWYREGLIDKEAFTLKQGQMDEKASSGIVGAIAAYSFSTTVTYNDNMKGTNPEAMFVGHALRDDGVPEAVIVPKTVMENWGYWVVRTDTPAEELKAFFDMMNLAAQDETFILTAKWGIEGQHWNFNEAGKVVETEQFMQRTGGDYNKMMQEGVNFYMPFYNYTVINKYLAPNSIDMREDMQATWKNLGTEYALGYRTDPMFYISAGPKETKLTLGAADRYKQMVMKAILAPSPDDVDAIVADWVATVKKNGYDEIVAERAEAGSKVQPFIDQLPQ